MPSLPFSCTAQLARAERWHEVAAAAAEQAGAWPVGAAHHVACRKNGKTHRVTTLGLSVMQKCCAGPAGCPALPGCLPLHQPKPQCRLRTRVVLALAALRPARAAGVLVLAACSSLVSFKSKRKLSAAQGAAGFAVPPSRQQSEGKGINKYQTIRPLRCCASTPTVAHTLGSAAKHPPGGAGGGGGRNTACCTSTGCSPPIA